MDAFLEAYLQADPDFWEFMEEIADDEEEEEEE